MKNFCLYNGKKIAKLETWNITSIELSGDYTSVIVQAESKSNKSEYTLDITPLISNQYKNGIDPYSSTVVNELTGVSDWILDPQNNSIRYSDPNTANPNTLPKLWVVYGHHDSESAKEFGSGTPQGACQNIKVIYGQGDYRFLNNMHQCSYSGSSYTNVVQVDNPNYDPNVEQEQEALPLETVAQKVISNAEGGDSSAQQAIISAFNNITDDILTSDYSEFFEVNKQPK